MFAATKIIQADKAALKPAYRYWRIFITSNNGSAAYVQVQEIELRATNGGADITNPSTPVAVSSSSSPAASLVDNELSTCWNSAEYATTNQWIRIDLSSPYSISQIAIASGGGLGNSSSPKNFSVQGSSDGSNFTTLATFSDVTGWESGTLRSFDV